MRLVITTDGSPRSFGVIPHACRVRRALGLDATMLRIIEDDASPLRPSAEIRDEILRLGAEAAVSVVHRAGGSVATRILGVAEELDAALLAMDSRGSGALRHAVLGSVALDVLRRGTIPVLITGAFVEPPQCREGLHLVVTSDGSLASDAILPALSPVIRDKPVRVTLLRLSVPRLGDDGPTIELARCQQSLEQLRGLIPPGIPVAVRAEALPEFETTAHGIARIAVQCGADAIAMSTHGHSALRHVVLGSTALAVLGRATVPLVLARAV